LVKEVVVMSEPIAKIIPLASTVRRRGRGLLSGRMVLVEDWDSPAVNDAVADLIETRL
jgi:antitoxin (DNA-binding transcriptional repressor) of toxin-antitoxin stability system